MEKTFVFYGEESGEICRSSSLNEIYKKFKEVKEFDRKNKIKDNYYFEMEIIKDNELIISDIKIYKRGNKIYCKYI